VKAAAATVASKIAAAMKGSAREEGEIVTLHPERAWDAARPTKAATRRGPAISALISPGGMAVVPHRKEGAVRPFEGVNPK